MHFNPSLKTDKELLTLLKNKPKFKNDEVTKQNRIESCRNDLFLFVKTYFSHWINNIETETSDFRNWKYSQEYEELKTKYQIIQNIVYRAGAKTTTSIFDRIHEIVYLKRNYFISISATATMAEKISEIFRIELTTNKLLIDDFEIDRGDIWSSTQRYIFIGKNRCKLEFHGWTSEAIRGLLTVDGRPNRVDLDDLENDTDVENPNTRDKMESWFKSAILKLKSRQDTNFNVFVNATVLHHDSFPKRLEKRKDTYTANFPLVKSFPNRMDKWLELYNLQDREIAKELYLNQKIYYDDGYFIDDENLDKFLIMMEYFEDPNSFMRELQNQPVASDSAILSKFKQWSDNEIPNDLYIAWGVDPAVGRKKGDFSSLSILGLSKNLKKRYVLDSIGIRVNPTDFLNFLFEKYKKHEPDIIVFETNGFQSDLKDRFEKMLRADGYSAKIIEQNSRTNKLLRLQDLAIPLSTGDLLICPHCKQLHEQLYQFPKGKNDDLIDSVEMADRNLSKRGGLDMAEVNKVSRTFLDKFRSLKNGIK